MAQPVEVLPYKPDDMSSVPGTHIKMEGEPTQQSCPLTSTRVLWHMRPSSPLHTQYKIKDGASNCPSIAGCTSSQSSRGLQICLHRKCVLAAISGGKSVRTVLSSCGPSLVAHQKGERLLTIQNLKGGDHTFSEIAFHSWTCVPGVPTWL